ncbi:hypothetical protein [Bdellovibrio sp. HCB288]|uniref:hypothetical protein n=1 Tax=Bdellovibrio sp. HCB288 TaxID=3394355 RepID=UPI0039B385CD
MNYFVCILLLLVSNVSAAHDAGVLLGFGKYRGDSGYAYETYWLGMRDGKAFVVGPLNDLLVPSGNGFYRVGIKAGCNLDLRIGTSQYLYVVPKDEQPVVSLLSCAEAERLQEKAENKRKKKAAAEGEECLDCDSPGSYEMSTWINLVTSKSVLYAESVYYDGGAHPDQGFEYKVRSIVADKSGYFDSISGNEFLREAKSIKSGDGDDKECLANAEYERIGWSVTRSKFTWEFKGYLPTHRLCGYGTDFSSKRRVDTPEVGPILPEGIKSQLKDKEDAFVSPDGQTVIGVSKAGFEIFTVKDGKLVARFKKNTNLGKIVLQEWASGQYVGKWHKTFSDLLRNKWKEPTYEKYDPKKHSE